jgi:uncharacterized membrane protein
VTGYRRWKISGQYPVIFAAIRLHYYPTMPLDLPRGRPRACLVGACALVLGLVLAAPWAAHRGSWAAPLLYAVFDPVCHQLAERSFQLWNEPLAVCHRCTGLYLGMALGVALWPAFPVAARRLLERPRAIVLFALPLAVDAVLLANTPVSRFATGLIAAVPAALLPLAAVADLARRVRSRSAPWPRTETTAPGGAR